MFGRKKHSRRSTNILFVVFRTILSLVMFLILLGGLYSAYKHFSGLDPLKLDPKSVAMNLLEGKVPEEVLTLLSSVKINQALPSQISEKVLGNKGEDLPEEPTQIGEPILKFLLIADSHNDNSNLNKAIQQAKQANPEIKFIIGLGDYTEVGTLEELKKAKEEFDKASLRYFLIPGDHDLWDSRDKNQPPLNNFRQVFGPSYQSFIIDNLKFLLLFNSDNYLEMDDQQLKWLEEELEKSKEPDLKGTFVFIHQPLFHPSSDHVMGRVEKRLKQQARNLTLTLQEARLSDGQAGVKKVFAGDTHYFSQYVEPETKLEMVTIGAVTIERNPQSPRFAIVTVYKDGSTKVDDIEIK